MPELLTVRTPALEIGYEAHGSPGGTPVVLLHGFPDDVHAFDDVAPSLAAAGCRVLVPYLRGYGPTRFLDPQEPRMAQQAAIGQDLLEFMAALNLAPAALAGYDWGGRAACISAILAPERVRALVTIGGYNVQNTLTPAPPTSAKAERSYWYQWYFNTERGRQGLEQNRRDIVERARVVGKAVEQDDGGTAGIAVRLVPDLERPRAHREDVGHRARSYVKPCVSGPRLTTSRRLRRC